MAEMRGRMTLPPSFGERVRELVERYQAHGGNSDVEEERWFATLRLDSIDVQGDDVTVIFDAPDGQRFGYRWRNDEDWTDLADTPEQAAVMALDVSLEEAVCTSQPTLPDPDGVRWLGLLRHVADDEYRAGPG